MLRMGIDGGGTTTRAVIIDHNRHVLGRGEAGPGNYQSIGLTASIANVAAAAERALGAARLPAHAIDAWGFGLAGACTVQDRALLREHLLPLAGGRVLVVEEDAVAAQVGAFGGGAGAICIAGTGANCFGINEKGEKAGADGRGPLLGDRGSGYWIGATALRTICCMADGCTDVTPLLDAVLAHLDVASIDQLMQVANAPDFAKDQVAALFPLVWGECMRGDAAAQAILLEAGRHLAATTGAVLHRLSLGRVAPCGGILSRATPVRAAFEDALRKLHPGAEIIEPQYDAVIGAALLAPAG